MESQTIKGPYKPRRIRRNPIPQLPRYFKTALWYDLKEKLEKAEHICFIIVQNGEVNNVYIKTISPIEQKTSAGNQKSNERPDSAVQPVQTGPKAGDQLEYGKDHPKAEETLHQNLEEPPLAKAPRDDHPQDDEIPEEEITELPPETPTIVPNPPATAIKPPTPVPASPNQPSESPEEEIEVVAGHRVKAIYENQEVKGTVSKVIKETGQPEEFIVILDSGRKVIMGEQKDGQGDGLLVLLTPEK